LEIIDDRLRGKLPEGQFYQIRLTFNPVNKNHWIKRVFWDNPDQNTMCHHSTYLMNRFVDDAYKQRMERRKLVDPEGYVIYGLGEWGEIGGLILHNWEVKEISQNLNDYDDIAIGQDFGFNHANAILLLGTKDDNIYILDEVYVFEKETAEIIPLASNMPKNKRMWCDSAEPDRIKMWKKAGYKAKGVDKGGSSGSVKAQIDWLKGIVTKDKTIKRMIYVHPHCVNTIKELQQWKWRKDEKTGEYLDEPVPFQDDAMAALRYGIEGWRKQKDWMT
jgi:phage terminase large subunit